MLKSKWQTKRFIRLMAHRQHANVSFYEAFYLCGVNFDVTSILKRPIIHTFTCVESFKKKVGSLFQSM